MPPKAKGNDEPTVASLRELLDQQDEQMRELFTKAINLFVAPGADEMVDHEKVDRLRKAVDDLLN